MGGIRRSIAALALFAALGCGDEANVVYVTVVTDFVVEVEFSQVRISLEDGEELRTIEYAASRRDDFGRGQRVAQFERGGESVVRAELLQADGRVVGRRSGVATAGSREMVLRIYEACRGVVCPTDADSEATECVGGVCVRPGCETTESGCADECSSDSECTSDVPCVDSVCSNDGVCFDAPLPDRCAPSEYCDRSGGCVPLAPLDGGMDAGDAALDAGPDASGPTDSGPMDSGPMDSGPVDSGPIDPRCGTACDPSPCETGHYDCGSGTLECVPDGNQPNGTVCGAETSENGECTTSSFCDTSGIREVSTTRNLCSEGLCAPSVSMANEPCAVETDGLSCGRDEEGPWTQCPTAPYRECQHEKTHSRNVSRFVCGSGVCRELMARETEVCASRASQEGVLCTDHVNCDPAARCVNQLCTSPGFFTCPSGQSCCSATGTCC